MKVTWRKVVASVVVTAGLVAVGATASNAISYPDDCFNQYICVYNQDHGADRLSRYLAPFGARNLSAEHMNKMSSWANHSVRYGGWFGLSDEAGPCYQMDSYTYNTYVGLLPNDSMNSWRGNLGC